MTDIRLQLLQTYNEVQIGSFYEIELGGIYQDKPWRRKIYKIYEKKQHNDYTFSFLCVGLDDKGNESVIYHWLCPNFYSSFSERIITFSKREGYNDNKTS